MQNEKKIIWSLVLVIVILLGVMFYAFYVKPIISNYVFSKQVEAKDITLASLISQIQQQGYAQIQIGNQSVILVPYIPPNQ